MKIEKNKKLAWIASSKKDLMNFLLSIRKEMGHALYISQQGSKHKNAKFLKGFGGGNVLEIVQDDRNRTFRTMYTVQFEKIIYVLHAFQKKSKTGIKTPKQDIDIVKQRLKIAELEYKKWLIEKLDE